MVKIKYEVTMNDLIKRLDEYIEYATSVKRLSDVAFYEELKEKLTEQENHLFHYREVAFDNYIEASQEISTCN
jgi:hypothetical protein